MYGILLPPLFSYVAVFTSSWNIQINSLHTAVRYVIGQLFAAILLLQVELELLIALVHYCQQLFYLPLQLPAGGLH